MSRIVSSLLLALTLVMGMFVGVVIDRRGGVISAGETDLPSGTSIPAKSTRTTPRAGDEDAAYQELTRQYAQFEVIDRTFELVARKVSPAVVHLVAEKPAAREGSSRLKPIIETGSGVIVRGDRGRGVYVLTNNHVVEGAQASKITVSLQDGRALHPEHVWLDPMADIAVLDLNRDDLFAARFGNSEEMAVGNWVLALGSPFGLTHSVTQGIISARGRHVEELGDIIHQDFLQTDAQINPGNSGGPLVNMKGEVIGINNSIASTTGFYEGVGFSIPSNLARWIMNELIKKGRVARGALGIDLRQNLSAAEATRLGLDSPHGAWVGQVNPASPASQAGLRDGDVILRFQETDIHDLNHLIYVVSMAPIGQSANLLIWRDKKTLTLRVTVGEREQTLPSLPALADAGNGSRGGLLRRPGRPDTTISSLGLHFQTIDEALARRLSLPTNLKGAVIVKVEPKSPLSALMQALDVVHSINGKGIATADDAVKALNAASEKEELQVGYDRVVKGVIERRMAKFQ